MICNPERMGQKMGRKWRQTALRLLPLVLRQPGLFQEKAMATHSSTFAWKIPWTAKTSFQNPYFSLSSLPQLITNPQYQRQRRPGRLLGLSGAPLYVSKASLLYLSHIRVSTENMFKELSSTAYRIQEVSGLQKKSLPSGTYLFTKHMS